MPKFYYETIELGDAVIPLTKPPVTRVQIAKFAGASRDYSPLHIDDDFAKSAGYGGVFAHGLLSLGFATEAVASWLENGFVLSSTAKFQKLVWPGDILTAKGVVVDRYEEHGESRIDIDVWAENQNHDIVMKGVITCVIWAQEKLEKKGTTPWPSITNATIAARRTAAPIAKAKPPAPRKAASEEAQQLERRHQKVLQRGTPIHLDDQGDEVELEQDDDVLDVDTTPTTAASKHAAQKAKAGKSVKAAAPASKAPPAAKPKKAAPPPPPPKSAPAKAADKKAPPPPQKKSKPVDKKSAKKAISKKRR